MERHVCKEIGKKILPSLRLGKKMIQHYLWGVSLAKIVSTCISGKKMMIIFAVVISKYWYSQIMGRQITTHQRDIWNHCWILTKFFKHHRNISNTRQYSIKKLNLKRLCNKRRYNEKLTMPLWRQESDKVVVFIWRYILKFWFLICKI